MKIEYIYIILLIILLIVIYCNNNTVENYNYASGVVPNYKGTLSKGTYSPLSPISNKMSDSIFDKCNYTSYEQSSIPDEYKSVPILIYNEDLNDSGQRYGFNSGVTYNDIVNEICDPSTTIGSNFKNMINKMYYSNYKELNDSYDENITKIKSEYSSNKEQLDDLPDPRLFVSTYCCPWHNGYNGDGGIGNNAPQAIQRGNSWQYNIVDDDGLTRLEYWNHPALSSPCPREGGDCNYKCCSDPASCSGNTSCSTKGGPGVPGCQVMLFQGRPANVDPDAKWGDFPQTVDNIDLDTYGSDNEPNPTALQYNPIGDKWQAGAGKEATRLGGSGAFGNPDCVKLVDGECWSPLD